MKGDQVTVWISKYALSQGIQSVECEESSGGYLRTKGSYPQLFRIGVDAHPTEADAKAAAEKMRLKKIASLKKQITKLEKLTF